MAKKTPSLVVNTDNLWHKMEIQLLNLQTVMKYDGKMMEGDSHAYVNY